MSPACRAAPTTRTAASSSTTRDRRDDHRPRHRQRRARPVHTYAEIGVRSYTPYRGHMYEWFVQDSWKATPKLRVELGLRHSIIQPYYSLWRNMVVFDPTVLRSGSSRQCRIRATGFIISGDRYNGLVIPGDGFPRCRPRAACRSPIPASSTACSAALPKQYSKIHKEDFQPRVGIRIRDQRQDRGPRRRRPLHDALGVSATPSSWAATRRCSRWFPSPTAGGQSRRRRPAQLSRFITTQDPIFQNPEAWTWNVTFEHEIGLSTPPSRSATSAAADCTLSASATSTSSRPGTVQANPGSKSDCLRPYTGFGPIRLTNNEASSRLQRVADRRQPPLLQGIQLRLGLHAVQVRRRRFGAAGHHPERVRCQHFLGTSELRYAPRRGDQLHL